jgi:BMFP domain-containing protein YqiC
MTPPESLSLSLLLHRIEELEARVLELETSQPDEDEEPARYMDGSPA